MGFQDDPSGTHNVIARNSNLRAWTYRAYYDKYGNLICIKAGCRVWSSFEQARAHYGALAPARSAHTNWHDSYGQNIRNMVSEREYLNWYAKRAEAKELLRKLENECITYSLARKAELRAQSAAAERRKVARRKRKPVAKRKKRI